MKKKTLTDNMIAALAKEAAEPVIEALPDDLLDQITGAGNPFENIPRVPTQPIDEELRKDG